MAVASSFQFDKNKKPPEYPKMPFKEEVDELLAQDEKWLKKEREKAYSHFKNILSRK